MAQSDPEVEAVLDALGLSHLAQRFATEDIDKSVFWSLQDSDLVELGLTLGQRKKLIARLKLENARAEPGLLAEDGSPELRRLTVLFADLAGFTDLATQIDPDDMRTILLKYYAAARTAAQTFGGFIASLQGDGVVMLFGYPATLAQEADRAVGAAHAMIDILRGFSHRLPDGSEFGIAVRIGIASGRAIVHRPGGDTHGEPQIVGSVTNRASRLQEVASPGAVIVDEPTRKLVSGAFSFTRLQDVELKGFKAKVEVSLSLPPVQQSGPAPVGFEAGRSVSSAHGREARLLAATLKSSAARKPALAVLTGEAGIGKSTLLAHFAASSEQDGALVRRLRCSALAANMPLRPVVEWLEEMLGAAADSAPAVRRKALRDLFSFATENEVEAVASHLGIDDPSSGAVLSPAETRRLSLAALKTLLIGSGERPILIAVEDIHWADDSTRSLLHDCAGTQPPGVVMLIATSRTGDEPLWSTFDNRLHIQLNALDAEASETVLQRHLSGVALPENVRRTILARSDGNPLMIEVLTRSAKDWQDVAPGYELRVPTSIYESISGRLESLQAGRKLAAVLAVFDEQTSAEMLAAVLDVGIDELEIDIAELVDAGIVERHGEGAQQILRFSHNLYRAVCYERLVKSERQEMHRAAYAILSRLESGNPALRPGLLALHAVEGGDHALAAPLAFEAGEQALKRSALIEASHFLREALASLDQIQRTRENDRLRLRVLVSRAAIIRARQGIAADEVGDLGRQVLELSKILGDTRAELIALNGLYAHSLVRAHYPEARAWAERLCEAARAAQDQTFLMIGNRGLGAVAFHTGSFDEAAILLRQALDSYDETTHAQLAHLHGYDHAEICAVFLSFTLWIKGDLQEAAAVSAYSVSHSRKIQHMHSLAQALVFRSMLTATARDFAASVASGQDAIDVSEKHGLAAMLGVAEFFKDLCGLSLLPNAPTPAELASLRKRHVLLKQVNPYNYQALTGALMADVHLTGGDVALASDALREAELAQDGTGEIFVRPELMRIKARLLSMQGHGHAARELLLAAFDDAQAMGAWMFALRIACDLSDAHSLEAGRERLSAARRQLISENDGWDMRRCQSLLDAVERR